MHTQVLGALLLACGSGATGAQTPCIASDATLAPGVEARAVACWSEPQPEGTLWLRLQLVAPDLGGPHDMDAILDGLQVYCTQHALPIAAKMDPPPVRVALSVSDRSVAFGEIDPSATQYFELFTPVLDAADPNCIWELF